ncbi:DUF3726 domain-containing protein [Anderseniella sp. Alg231-50]|uniref:DUF3726 domain-containing protein n=1 Tax=Anderseniella sp. Alg231-50 TaxID=1922226 RepID=UPI000D5571E7
MIVSLNEAEVMATKAAWGAGRPWGLAQEAGRAVSALESLRLPGARSLLDLLVATDRVPCEKMRPASVHSECWQAGHPMCPVLVGAFIADMGMQSEEVNLRRVHAPLLLVSFCQTSSDKAVVSWDDCSIHTSDDGVSVRGVMNAPIADRVLIARCEPAGDTTHHWHPGAVDIADEIWEALSAFAHRTYVPATEASRLKGAGAGLTDND